MLAQYQKNRLENIQKRCLRSIFGHDKTYNKLLAESGLETLEDRRTRAVKKFAEKACKNPQFEHWFPKNTNRSSQRTGKTYEELYAKSDIIFQSVIYYAKTLK